MAKFIIHYFQTEYKLSIEWGSYYGTAGNSLSIHDGSAFSTKDRGDNYCATYRGGWWFLKGRSSCLHSNLNGHNEEEEEGSSSGINWYDFTNDRYRTLKSASMSIRPMNVTVNIPLGSIRPPPTRAPPTTSTYNDYNYDGDGFGDGDGVYY